MKNFSLAFLLLFTFTASFAKQHIIDLSAVLETSRPPAAIAVSVGDTITWVGNFADHVLTSVSVPAGAASFSISSGTTFSYIVEVNGNYQYEFIAAENTEINGAFIGYTAIASTVVNGDATSTLFVFNQQNGTNVLSSNLDDNSLSGFTASVYDLTGRLMLSVPVAFNNSKYTLPRLFTGIYIVRVTDSAGHQSAIKMWQP